MTADVAANGELKPSRWDTSSFPISDRFDPTTLTSLSVKRRTDQRVSIFERAFSGQEADVCRRAGEEYTRRINRFREYADDVAMNISFRAWPGSRTRLPLLSGPMISFVIVLVIGLAFAFFQLGGAGWLMTLPFILFPTLGTWRGWWTNRRLERAINEDKCADCGYSLAGVPPGIAAEITGVSVGPRACPECGAAWPLVPAEVG